MKGRSENILNNHRTNPLSIVARALCLLTLLCSPALAYAKENAAVSYDDPTNAILPVFILFIITSVLVILFLAISLIHCRRKLRQCHENLLRCVTENLELKKNIPNSEHTNLFSLPDITPEEFVKVMDMMLRRIMKNTM